MQQGMPGGFRDWVSVLEHEGFSVEVHDVKLPTAFDDEGNGA